MDYSVLGKTPIPGNSPAGCDVRYEANYDVMQSEIDKLSSLSERNQFSWQKVVESASAILKEESKDLLAASYLGVALVAKHGVSGLSDASQIMEDLLSEYWETMFPVLKRKRGRIAAVEWWVERLSGALETCSADSVTEEQAQEILERFNRIDQLLETHLGDEIMLRPLIRSVETFLRNNQVTEDVPAPEEESVPQEVMSVEKPAVVEAPSPQIEELSVPEVTLDTAALVHRQLNPVFLKIAQASKIIREAEPVSEQCYHWLRFAAYEPVKALPPADAEGKTRIVPPSPQLVSRLVSLHKGASWKELLNEAEAALMDVRHVFWLDLSRYTAEALAQLGPEFSAARETVCTDTHRLLERLPGIERLRFSDDMPFADEETQTWLSGLVETEVEPEMTATVTPVFNSTDDALAEVLEQACELAKDPEQLSDAFRILEEQMNRSSSAREVLELRLVMLQLLAAAKKDVPAAVQASLILEAVERFDLCAWDAPLALRCMVPAYKALKKNQGEESKEHQQAVYRKIAALSTTDVLGL